MGGTQPRWSRDGKELYYISAGKIFVVKVQTGATFQQGLSEELFPTQIFGLGGGADVTLGSHPRRAAFSGVTQAPSDVQARTEVVLNWQAGLRK